MSLDDKLGIGVTVALGSHTFEADEIKDFARKYDPQPFHVSEREAEKSVFGSLCASGWHTAAMWMRHNVASMPAAVEHSKRFGEPVEYGPAAGLRNLKWLKPVYVGDTITFTRTPESHRALQSRPGWRLLTSLCEAFNQRGGKVMEFEVMVLMRVPEDLG
jgi:acyl dehydratase